MNIKKIENIIAEISNDVFFHRLNGSNWFKLLLFLFRLKKKPKTYSINFTNKLTEFIVDDTRLGSIIIGFVSKNYKSYVYILCCGRIKINMLFILKNNKIKTVKINYGFTIGLDLKLSTREQQEDVKQELTNRLLALQHIAKSDTLTLKKKTKTLLVFSCGHFHVVCRKKNQSTSMAVSAVLVFP
jgi:hypothetical protein